MIKRQLTEEQLDNLMRSMMNDAAADEATVNEIADSPGLWWAVERQINKTRESGRMPWPPRPKIWSMLLGGVPVAAAVLILMSFMVFRPVSVPVDQVNVNGGQGDGSLETFPPNPLVTSQPEPEVLSGGVTSDSFLNKTPSNPSFRKASMKRTVANRKPATQTAKRAEIKTEFIALSYAGNPESGQIVRIKVPSSMMVSLGLMSTVARPNSLVNAEVVVGDDGMSHAIRFIR
jgi:hypothetical protein